MTLEDLKQPRGWIEIDPRNFEWQMSASCGHEALDVSEEWTPEGLRCEAKCSVCGAIEYKSFASWQ